MSDLSKLSDEELMRLYHATPEPKQAPGAAPTADLSKMSDADLMKLHASFTDAPSSGVAGDGAAAVGRGIIDGVPVVGPYLTAGVNKAVAGVRALQHDTKYSDELRNVENFGRATAAEHPIADMAGQLAGGVVGTLPLVAAAPAAFGAGAGGLAARTGASLLSGGVLGGADAAVRNDGDLAATKDGALIGAGLGAAGPIAGRLVGKAVTAMRGGDPGMHLLREATHGISESELASAQAIRDTSHALPGGGVEIPLDEALNRATDGRAGRVSQLARVAANSGGEGGRIASEVYAGRPASIDNVSRALFDQIAPENVAPSAVGLDVQSAARAGVRQTPEGVALDQARAAVGPRVTPDQAGRTIQPEMRNVADAREAVRSLQADRDYAAARAAPENAGIERTITVERPGEPIVTQPAYSRPQFEADAPRPADPAPLRGAPTEADAQGESLARFIARNGGLDLTSDLKSQDFHRFNIPGAGTVAREGGKPLDAFWRVKLMEAGYLRPDADGGMARDIRGELMRKLTNERRGVPSYPIGQERAPLGERLKAGQIADDFSHARDLAESRLNEDLTRVGVDPASVHPDIRDRVLGTLMRDGGADPVEAYEAVIGKMKGPLEPYVKTPTITEEIPDVRFGQVNPMPALDAVAGQARTAKGDVRGALGNVRRDLIGADGQPDMSVEGLLHARERNDFAIRQAQEVGDNTKVRDLTIPRQALDRQLKAVPEVATADANFAANSRPLEPFTGNTPLGRVVQRDPTTGRMATPTEQVPTHLRGASAAREFLANATPAARQAYEGHVATRILDAATDRRGTINPDALNQALREHVDVLTEMPDVYHRLDDVVRARDGLARVEKSPLGQLAQTDDVRRAVNVLFPQVPQGANHHEIAAAMTAVARNNPAAARDLTRIYLETLFNESTQQVKGIAAQYGGAGFASAVRGNPQQRHNLEAVLRVLPDGEMRAAAVDRLLTTLEATGYRPQKGSDTAFNQAIQKQLASGNTPVGQAITSAASGAAAGASVGGFSGALGGGVVGLKHGISDAMTHARMMGNGEAVARLIYDPKALPDLRALSKSPPGSKNAELFTARLLRLANDGQRPVVNQSAAAR
ncbi:hypothetical protein ACFZ8E_25155 [Methylobacterium sp. HMF5984]|uniref:hypothetical protein n=1 Tax=Methylobacterium sp. HMF5984 TaxID=3367370 RepID=UPI003852C3F0